MSADKLLDRMRANPRDWRIEEVGSVCGALGIECSPPGRGSHYKIGHASVTSILTIPARRPIKRVYIRDLVRFIDQLRGDL